MKLISLNPFSEEVNGEFEFLTEEEIQKALSRSREAFAVWKNTGFKERAGRIFRLGEILLKNKKQYAELITREMGKTIRESAAEIEKCAWLTEYYAENLEKFLVREIIQTEAKKSYAAFEPLGVILAIMPWNFPFWQVFRAAVPAIAAGNAVLLKHAASVPLSALAIEEIFTSAGLKDIFQTLLIDERSAMNLIEEDQVEGVTLTGSNRAGEQIGALAGKKIKKTVLELGGSDPFIVLDDADLKIAARAAVIGRFANAGQSCIAAKRFIVMEPVAEEFTAEFHKNLMKLKIGDPMDEKTDMGPLAQERFVRGLNIQLEESLKSGGEILKGPEIKEARGFFFRPLIFLGARPGMKIMDEEVFGPIAPIAIVKSEEEAIKISNSTIFGLGASIWTKDLEKGENLSRRIDAGFISINDVVKSDPRLPFGGIKKSGIGRELSHFGLKEFANIKTISVNESKNPAVGHLSNVE